MEVKTEIKEKNLDIEQDTDTLLRFIFLTLLKIFFIILVYFYLAQNYGSISNISIGNSEFLPFVASLFALVFLSFLAGPIPGFLSGLLGELIYQFSFYNEIYIQWCVVLAILGGICGAFKFKPLKYQKFKSILQIILVLNITGIISILFLIGFEPASIILSFFIQLIVSVIFLVPFVLYIYDRILSSNERHIYHEFLTHHPHSASDHTFCLQFGRTYIYFCTRCSGFVIGALFSMFVTYLITLIFNIEISPEIAIAICIILPIPGLVDWGTQRLMLRKSTTESRLFTGFIIGIALHFISFTKPYAGFLFILIIFYFSVFFIMMYFGAKKEMRLWQKEWDKLSNESDQLSEDLENTSEN